MNSTFMRYNCDPASCVQTKFPLANISSTSNLICGENWNVRSPPLFHRRRMRIRFLNSIGGVGSENKIQAGRNKRQSLFACSFSSKLKSAFCECVCGAACVTRRRREFEWRRRTTPFIAVSFDARSTLAHKREKNDGRSLIFKTGHFFSAFGGDETGAHRRPESFSFRPATKLNYNKPCRVVIFSAEVNFHFTVA